MSLLRLLALAFTAVVVLAACREGDTPEEKTAIAELLEFVSDDGFFTFGIPEDLVEDGFDLTITAVPPDQLPPELANLSGGGTGYEIEPAGMTFEAPITATLKLDLAGLDGFPMSGADAYGLLGFSEGGERTPLSDLTTEFSLGEAFLTATGTTTTLPEFIGRTKGSLRAEMDEIGTLPVGEFAAVEFTLRNAALPEDGVTLKGASADASGSAAISVTTPPTLEPTDLAAGATAPGDFDIKCADDPGTGVYTLEASSTSLVEGGSAEGVPLRIVLDSVVDCVDEDDAGEPTEPPEDELDLPPGLRTYLLAWGVPEDDLDLVAFTQDEEGDHFYSDPSKEAGFTPEYTDLSGVFAASVELTEEAAETINSLYTCGATVASGIQTVCSNPTAAVQPGRALIVGGTMVGRFPDLPDRVCVMGSVFDAGNPWEAYEPYTKDFYLGAGVWYEVGLDATGVAQALASRVGDQQEPRQPFTSNSRFYLARDMLTFGGIIPLTEVTGASGYRVTAFCHKPETSLPSDAGGDIAPGRDPTAFREIPTGVITLKQICGGTCLNQPPRERIL
ncbi:MAG: hypothetical protein WD379_01610 [Dehalococcoidia bacterium]